MTILYRVYLILFTLYGIDVKVYRLMPSVKVIGSRYIEKLKVLFVEADFCTDIFYVA
jgi:hypothetical protein